MTLLGPCMFLAPLAAVLAILALPLWPVAIVFMGALWLIVWVLETLARALGARVMIGWTATVGRWFHMTLKPWQYFDSPAVRAARRKAG